MPAKRVSQLFKDLPFDKKLLGIGSLLLIASVFFPWYQDRDSFNTGDMFLGVTGPLYFIGFTLLVLGIINLVLITSESTGKKFDVMPMKSSTFYMGSGLVVFYLLMMTSSIYFHQKFGINITWKESQFGMFMAFIAASLVTIGGYLAGRDPKALMQEFQDGAKGKTKEQEPLVTMPQKKETVRTQQQKSPEGLQQSAQANVQNKQMRVRQAKPENPQPFRMDL